MLRRCFCPSESPEVLLSSLAQPEVLWSPLRVVRGVAREGPVVVPVCKSKTVLVRAEWYTYVGTGV